MVILKDIKNNPEIKTYLEYSNKHLGAIGFTEHGFRHAEIVSRESARVLKELGFPQRDVELAEIAGYMHDMGNVISRYDHGQTGALIAMGILKDAGMDYDEIAIITAAIGNHEEEYGQAVNRIASALILADKSDVHRGRVRNRDKAAFDIHDRVKYAAEESKLIINKDAKSVQLKIRIDIEICPVMEYFEIFLVRMLICRKAAEFLGVRFQLVINEARML